MDSTPITWSQEVPTIVERFAEVVAEVPDHVAVTDGDDQLTFTELDVASRAFAQRLATGDAPEAPVALLFDHGIDVVVAMLAAVRAGRPFTVIDPATPASRMLQVADDVDASIVAAAAARAGLAEQLTGGFAQVVPLAGRGGDGREVSGGIDAPGTNPVAGIFYTSGSTGEPKGVMRSQEAIVRRVRYEQDLAGLGPGHVLSLLYSCSYGASQNDLWAALLSGARLALYPVAAVGVGGLADWIERERVTWLHVPIALLRQLLDVLPSPHRFDSLRHVLPSGRYFGSDVEAIRASLSPDVRIYSQFASTETSIAARFVIEPADTLGPDEVAPVGCEVPGVRITVVDDDGHELDAGSEGRLLVTSPLLSPGYWRKPDQTAAVFEPDPHDPTLRRFTTGDYGRRDERGLLHFVGRRDDRVKVRGYRVELNEVANRVRELDSVRDAHVALDTRHGERLVAYVVAADENGVDHARLRRDLSDRIAAHKIPSIFVELEQLPLTANGKLDVAQLPPAEPARPLEADPVAPSTATERVVADIWREALGIDDLGAMDSFADLGGDSLTAMRVVAQVVERCAVEIPLRELLEQGTVASMATLIDSRKGAGVDPIEPAPGDRHALSHQQQNLWVSEQLNPNGELNSVRILDLIGPLDVDALGRCVDRLIERHDMLRVIFPFDGGEPAQQILDPPSQVLRVVHPAAGADHDAVERRVQDHLQTPIDLARGPLVSVDLFVRSPEEATLVLTGHHVCSDRTSGNLMIDDLAALYRHELGLGPEPAPPALRYVDYAAWQRNRLPDDAVEEAAARWEERLLPPPPDPVPLVRTHREPDAGPEITMPFKAAAPAGEMIAALAREERTTPFTVVLACLKAAVHGVTGIGDLVVTTVLTGRDRPELEHLVGCLVSALPIRTTRPPDATLRRWVQAERQATLDAFGDRDVPFSAIVGAMNPPRRPGRTPFADLTLNFTLPPATTHDFGPVLARRRQVRSAGEVTFAVQAQVVEGALVGSAAVDPSWIDPVVARQVVAELGRIAQIGPKAPDQRLEP